MKLIKKRVQTLLHNHSHLREDDLRLIANIWFQEAVSHGADQKAVQVFLDILVTGQLTSPETIRRTRQKIQEQVPYLRGKNYKARHKEEKRFRKNIRHA